MIDSWSVPFLCSFRGLSFSLSGGASATFGRCCGRNGSMHLVFGIWLPSNGFWMFLFLDALDSKQSKGQVLLTYRSPPMSRNRWGMVTEVGDILEAKSELCKDDPCDFNFKTGSLRLYRPGVYKSQWDVQERLKDWKAVGGVGSRFNRTHTRYECHHSRITVSQYFSFW